MRTVVVTDSSAQPLPTRTAGHTARSLARSVVVVPITILLADRQLADDAADVSVVHDAIAGGQPIKTRAPSVIDYLDAIESTDAQSAVILTPAAELTAMWRHASHIPWLADRPVAVVDSRTAASGQSLVVEAAADAAAAGNSLSEVAAVARDAASRARVVGAVGSVEPLVTSGMVERQRLTGDVDRRPRPTVFEARLGAIEPLRVLDGEDPAVALANLYDRDRRSQSGFTASAVVFTSAAPSPELRAMARRLADLVGTIRAPQTSSAAMTVYTGRDTVGLAWLD
jgi:fatty acid-binding protein DegV